MTRTATAIDYGARIERVVAHIWENLDRSLALERLAEVACFSPYHFHRIYRLTTGETTDQTVRRLRLHRAAAQLSSDDLPLERIAKSAGYGSTEAFSRAFSSAYGKPPSQYRNEHVAESKAPGRVAVPKEYEVTIGEQPALRLVGFPHVGDYQKIGSAFERLYAWAGPRGLLGPDTRHVGVYYSDETASGGQELRSFAGITVADDFMPEGGVEIVEIPAGTCAELIHKGPYAELNTAYNYLYGEWLTHSGREPADQPCIEQYLNDPRTLPPTEWLTAVRLPLA